MPALLMLRHGPTDWSAAHRLQGRSDLALSDVGRAIVETWRLPERAACFAWVSSPLRRCRETADILRRHHPAAGPVHVERRITEMSFGEWEGRTLSDLRAADGEELAEREGRGLDFRAPGGESPREVQARLRPWLEEIAAADGDVLAIAHKGVIRALYALASGWDMRAKPMDRLVDNAVHAFAIDRRGIRVDRLNIPLQPEARLTGAPA
jgi:probable phosphoglycerate mutase